MNPGGFRFHLRERRLALIAAVLIFCWLLLSVLVQPLWNRARDLRAEAETQQEKLDALSRLLSQAPAIEQQYQALAAFLEPEDDERVQGAFLENLESLSRQSDLQLNLKPRPLKQEDRVSRFEVELDVEGSQQNLMTFLDALLRMPKLIAVERIRISSVPAKADLLRANLVIQKLTLHQ